MLQRLYIVIIKLVAFNRIHQTLLLGFAANAFDVAILNLIERNMPYWLGEFRKSRRVGNFAHPTKVM